MEEGITVPVSLLSDWPGEAFDCWLVSRSYGSTEDGTTVDPPGLLIGLWPVCLDGVCEAEGCGLVTKGYSALSRVSTGLDGDVEDGCSNCAVDEAVFCPQGLPKILEMKELMV
jgi:hypothetical protein